jgi:hypothetical protein
MMVSNTWSAKSVGRRSEIRATLLAADHLTMVSFGIRLVGFEMIRGGVKVPYLARRQKAVPEQFPLSPEPLFAPQEQDFPRLHQPQPGYDLERQT